MDTKKLLKHVPWALLGILGAFCLAVVALRRGEHVSALWIVVASVSVGTVAKLAMRQPFVLFKGLTFQKLCLP
ncbi:hypothetical protein, partial [Enterobacter kobei]|uniref:hypothetical protein n=1 Tax=Enterobacter kobei TaxID=208224 RepID=UPI001E471F62